ncbi:hypothetical protein [Saccharopolyspora pogona]|uniref:hypothetical protein n=1 Tax=Saccharopolyspora pogona TaxID=333966 RepID=UPI00168411DC|nr:hypothetical protein [Saccharopolyspora pogona]
MMRAAITFDISRARQIHDVLSCIVPGTGQPQPHNPLGVLTGSVFPTEEVLAGATYAEVTSAVYIVTDDGRTVRYVGSVDRSSPALKSRLAAHLQHEATRRRTWTGLGLVRIPPGSPRKMIRRCDGWVGRVLDLLENDRLPLAGGQPWIPRPRAR